MSEYRSVGRIDEVEEGKGRRFEVEGKRIAVFRVEGEWYALDDQCTHADASLADGWLGEGCVSCPWHGAEFDLRTGEAKSLPAVTGVKTYAVRLSEAGEIEVAVAGDGEE